MGVGAMAPCTCFLPLSEKDEITPHSNEEELHAAFKIDIQLPKQFAASPFNSSPRGLSMTDHVTVSSSLSYSNTGSGELVQQLHQLPFCLLKQLLLGLLERRNALFEQQTLHPTCSKLVLEIPAIRPWPPLHLHISSSSLSQRVRVLFDTSRNPTEQESAFSMSLQLCGRCGADAACNCGWRRNHAISPGTEQQSVLEFIATALPQIPTTMVQAKTCYHLRLGEVASRNNTVFGVQIYGHDVQQPIIEWPYIVFKMKTFVGDLTWRIARRYSEFAALHAGLKMAMKECMLPQFPPSKWFSVTEPNFISQRLRLLENYLKGVFMIDELLAAVPLLVFLGVLSTSYVDHVALRSYRRQILHLQVLEFYTRPGDLILFNGRAKGSALQRSMTRSEWDHVAIVVPSRDGGLLQLLEATSDGVILSPLTARLLAYSTFHARYFSLRKIRTPLLSRSVVDDLLGRFTFEVEGLPYGLSLRRILHATSTAQSRSQDTTFFCSELVAEAYKALGIISSSCAANDFWPGCFSPGGFVDAQLARYGASLSSEIIIDCKLLEVGSATQQ